MRQSSEVRLTSCKLLGVLQGQIHELIFTTNSLETIVEVAKTGLGILGCYEELRIIQNSGLKNILPKITGEKIKEYFIYPKSLEKDLQIIDLKNYLFEQLPNIK